MKRLASIALTSFAAIAVAACSGDTGSPAPPSEPAGSAACTVSTAAVVVTVDIEGRTFDPGTVRAKVGEVIGWTNHDGVPHTATLDDGSCTTENIGKDATGSLVFSAPGSYPYHCRIHPDMLGRIEIES
jgi:plastocyanin